METAREHALSAWRDLDVVVAAEFDAFEAGRLRRRPPPKPEDPAAADEAAWQEAEADPDDEEAFIERTAGWLHGRADAEALLDAVRSALAEPAPSPTEAPAAPEPIADVSPEPPPAEPSGDTAD
jgi:hypothetical protein